MKKSALLALGALAAALHAAPAAAQVFTRPFLDWRTVRTEHFTVHYPAEMAAWTLDVASRLESVHAAVSAMVGYAPDERVTIVVEDPTGQTNGFAYPFLDQPAIALWPTPPDPRSNLGHYRDAGEQLVVHEYAHIAHLARPSRNPGQRFLIGLSPVKLGPVARKAPRWVTEGYATYVEGRLTGLGRPNSAIRAAVLRQWALEGRLPTYGQLSSTQGYYGGAMAYLAGSAFLEWLAAERGDSSLVHLWRRMSARQDRSFGDAFAGVYGGPPQELYGRFTVELTERALQARRELRAAGLAEGDTVQRLAWGTGDPAISPDGQQMAVLLRNAPGVPSRVVVWRTADEPGDSAAAEEARRLLARDPLDVPDVRWRPRPKRPLATLHPVAGRGHDMPRFTRDGNGVLVVRTEPVGDGSQRPDLFVWSWRTGEVRRVTRGASVRWPDPAPDGRTAAAVRCLGGVCDLVRIDLRSGAVATIAAGSPRTVFYRPRWSPDGAWIVAAVQESGRWRLERIDAASGARTPMGPDDGASRYDASFLPDGRFLVATSERGGVANLEILDTATGDVRPLTRVTGAAVAPAPDPATGRVFYLSMHAGGLDLMRIDPDTAAPGPVVALSPALAPAAPPAPRAPADTFARQAVAPRPYGLGPRGFRLLAESAEGPDGGSAGLVVVNTDPVGRLTVLGRGVLGDKGVPWGGSVSAAWRGWRPAVTGEGWWMRHDPARSGSGIDGGLDADYHGGALALSHGWAGSVLGQRVRAGASYGRLELDEGGEGDRRLAFAEYAASAARTRGRQSLSASLWLHGAAGRTTGGSWTRGVGTFALGLGMGRLALRGDVTYGRVGDGAPRWERFVAGGVPQSLFDDALLSQRIPRPGVRFGVRQGTELLAVRAGAPMGGLTPYVWAVTTDPWGDGDAWYRVAGVETSLSTDALNLVRIPGIRLLVGLTYPLDEPFRHEIAGYATLSYRP